MPTDHTSQNAKVSIRDFVDLASKALSLRVIGGDKHLNDHFLDSPRVQKLGLALSGFAENVHAGRIQIFGNSERNYVARIPDEEVAAAFEKLAREPVTCVLMTAGTEAPKRLFEYSQKHEIPLLATDLPSSEAISGITYVLGNALAPSITLHGVMVEVYGIGVLIRGESGIGKSECALELISRGHRLISDDMVTLKRVTDKIYGEAPRAIKDQLEIRGLGILNARELFGVSALSPSGQVRLCLDLIPLAATAANERLGIEPLLSEFLGVKLDTYCIPVSPGRNLATLAEAAVRVFVSRHATGEARTELIERHDLAVASRTGED